MIDPCFEVLGASLLDVGGHRGISRFKGVRLQQLTSLKRSALVRGFQARATKVVSPGN